MLLCITFEDELLPFIIDEATTDEVFHAIKIARTMFEFSKANYIVEADRVVLHAYPKRTAPKPKKRLYCYNDKVILETDSKYPDEVEPTRILLSVERNIPMDRIQVIEV